MQVIGGKAQARASLYRGSVKGIQEEDGEVMGSHTSRAQKEAGLGASSACFSEFRRPKAGFCPRTVAIVGASSVLSRNLSSQLCNLRK